MVAPSPSGAVQPLRLAISRPRREAGPAPTPSSARPSEKPASVRLTCLKVHRRFGPRVGRTSLPARRSSTSSLVESGVWLSKNSQFAMTTGA